MITFLSALNKKIFDMDKDTYGDQSSEMIESRLSIVLMLGK